MRNPEVRSFAIVIGEAPPPFVGKVIEVHEHSMPGGCANAGATDALPFGREFEHHIDAGIAGVGMVAGKDIDGIDKLGSICSSIARSPAAMGEPAASACSARSRTAAS